MVKVAVKHEAGHQVELKINGAAVNALRYEGVVMNPAGTLGGELMAIGTPLEIENNQNSLTGQYLSGKLKIAIPKVRRKGTGKSLKLIGATGNNLKCGS